MRTKGVLPLTIEETSIKKTGLGFRRSRNLALFAKQFSVMLHAGLPLIQCLSVLIEQQENAGFRTTLIEVRGGLESGSSFAEALQKHPKVFDTYFIQMIAAGEAGGFLDLVLQRLSDYIQRSARIRRKAISASAYPIVVAAVALVTVSLTLLWVVPVFVSLFEQMEAPLPLLTQGVIGVSRWTQRLWIPILLMVLLGVLGFKSLQKNAEGQLAVDRVLLRMPLFGGILKKIAVARFSLTLATLLKSGVPLIQGLEITAACSGSCVFENALATVRKEVMNGRTLAEPMEEAEVFPPLVTRMVAVGEQAGELDQMLEHLSTFYEEESESTVDQLMTVLEPSLVLVLGILVGGIVLSMYLPIFTLVGHFAH